MTAQLDEDAVRLRVARRSAVRIVASHATNAVDLAMLLETLGLEPLEGKVDPGDPLPDTETVRSGLRGAEMLHGWNDPPSSARIDR